MTGIAPEWAGRRGKERGNLDSHGYGRGATGTARYKPESFGAHELSWECMAVQRGARDAIGRPVEVWSLGATLPPGMQPDGREGRQTGTGVTNKRSNYPSLRGERESTPTLTGAAPVPYAAPKLW